MKLNPKKKKKRLNQRNKVQNQIEQYLKNSISEEKKKGQNKSKKVKGSTSLLHTTI